jgi:archaellum biogenesis protein FlaJ (TadC family)
MFPLGIVCMRATKEIESKDREIGPFLRSFGAVASSTGTTLAGALTQLDPSSFPNLQSDLKRLIWRLKASIPPALCWQHFARETGSKLIRDTIAVFYDAIKLGGDTSMVGSLCSQFATTEVMLRARRRGIASTFSNLTIVMHVAVSALMIIILEVIQMFTDLIAAAASSQAEEALHSLQLPMLSFASPLMGVMSTLTHAMVVVLALINAYAIVAADGGHILKGSFYLSILLVLSGLGFVAGPSLVHAVLKVG